MKKFLCLVVTGIMTLSLGSICMAAERDVTYGKVDAVIIDRPADEIYPVVDEKAATDGYSRASWGKGILHAEKKLGKLPSAYAETQTYSGTVYCMYAKTELIDDDSIYYETGIQYAYSVGSVYTAPLNSFTEKCDFIGKHGLQDTSSSGWQTCKTHKNYS